MKNFFLFLLFISGCSHSIDHKTNLPPSFESGITVPYQTELDSLSKNSLATIDTAVYIFEKYAAWAKNDSQRDSLFQPFFAIYMVVGNQHLSIQDSISLNQYGFKTIISASGKKSIVPYSSEYMNRHILVHLSPVMQKFCKQQLNEFDSNHTLKEIGKNTIWWENFIREHPNFFMKEMVDFHYEKWHLKNLMNGTKKTAVFDGENKLTDEARMVYENIIEKNRESDTAEKLMAYLGLLESNSFVKNSAVEAYLGRVFPN